VQNRFSLLNRTHEEILHYCIANDIAFIAYGPLEAHPLQQGSPLVLAEDLLQEMATTHNARPTQTALAWRLHRAPNIVLIPGTTAIAHLEENQKST
jgi:aryl-alcohol dehydrogenase-like predicted oxidoreductase